MKPTINLVLLTIGVLSSFHILTAAHQAVGDDDEPEPTPAPGNQGAGLETSSKHDRKSEKYPLWHSFAGEPRKKRGHLIVYRSKKTEQIVDLDVVEDAATK